MSSSVVVSLSAAGSSMNILFTRALLTPWNPWNGHRAYSRFISMVVFIEFFPAENQIQNIPRVRYDRKTVQNKSAHRNGNHESREKSTE